MKLKEVTDFIGRHRIIFDALEITLRKIAKANEEVGTTIENGYYKKVKFQTNNAQDNQKNIIKVDLDTSLSNAEIFKQLLLNFYNQMKHGKSYFQFEQEYTKRSIKNVKFSSKEEKLSFLGTLYTILFNYQYTSSVDMDTLEDFLKENALDVIQINKESITQLKELEVIYPKQEDKDQSKTTMQSYTNAYKLIDDIEIAFNELKIFPQTQIGGVDICKSIQNSKPFNYLTKSCQEAISIIMQLDTNNAFKSDMSFKLKNDFALKAIKSALPEVLNEETYKRFIQGLVDRKVNNHMRGDSALYIAGILLIEKYGYINLRNMYFAEMEAFAITRILNAQYESYKNIIALDKDAIVDVLKLAYSQYANSDTTIVNQVIPFYILQNMSKEDLNFVLEQTKEYFKNALKRMDVKDISKILNLYTKESVNNKELLKIINKEFSQILYYEESGRYANLTSQVRELIAKDYLNSAIKSETISQRDFNNTKSAQRALPSQTPKMNEIYISVYNDFAELFDYEKIKV